MKKLALLILILCIFPTLAFSHSGGQDSNGGHVSKSTGKYHCHKPTCVMPDSRDTLEREQPQAHSKQSDSTTALEYNRDNWKHWIDTDHDCQDTRNEILIRDSQKPVTFKTSRQCEVASGHWIGPYTGRQYWHPGNMDIDHIVPLGHAYKVGGATWTKEQKKAFANDYDNLLATDAVANRSKGLKAPHQWMPPRKEYYCEYISRWTAIKEKYGLIYLPQETSYIEQVAVWCNASWAFR
jgi:hypothetical protein